MSSGFSMHLSEVTRAFNVTLPQAPNADPPLTGVSTDSRSTKEGELFVALSGLSFDGHAFVGNGHSFGSE